jgi:hypothetical protein
MTKKVLLATTMLVALAAPAMARGGVHVGGPLVVPGFVPPPVVVAPPPQYAVPQAVVPQSAPQQVPHNQYGIPLATV